VDNHQIIDQILKIKYLGIDTSQGLLQDEVKGQINKANRISGCLNDTVWNNKYISRETKSRIYKTVVKQILADAAEARPDTAYSNKALETAEMITLRRITRNRLNDRVRNEYIRQLCKTPPINEWILGRRMEWNDHICRMTSTRLVKITRDKAPNSNKTLEDRRKDGTNPWKLVRNRLKVYLQEEEEKKKMDRICSTYRREVHIGLWLKTLR
jgi:hypothetical protein